MSPLIERTRQTRCDDRAGRRLDGAVVEHERHVIAHPGQGAEVDLGEAEVRDRLEGLQPTPGVES